MMEHRGEKLDKRFKKGAVSKPPDLAQAHERRTAFTQDRQAAGVSERGSDTVDQGALTAPDEVALSNPNDIHPMLM